VTSLSGQPVTLTKPLKVFPGSQHGFCFPERAVYDTLAAEETWSKIFAMWDRRLK
jgi:carboxymethylenebutenolidase